MTELTKPTRLQLPTDWTFCAKPSSTRPSYPSLLTPPSSPLSLPPSVNFPTPLLPSCNHSCFYLDPKCEASPSCSTSNPSSVCAMEQLSKQGVEGEVTPADSTSSKAFLKDSSSAFIPMYSRTIMPYPGSPGAPFFEGSNITDFLKSYSRMCIDYHVDEHEKIKRLFWYCELFTGKYIDTLITASWD